jgi:hypothetical protein
MTIPAQFDAKTIEDKWYDYWMKTIIHSEPDHRTPYTIVIPPQCYWSFTHGTYVKQYDSRCLDKKSTSQGI